MSSRSLNKVQLIGNLTRDPELRYTPSGTAVCSFGLATNRSWTTDSGEKREDTEFHRIVAWNKLAELCAQLLFKGRKAYVEGRLQTRIWTAQDGSQRQTTEVVIEEMIILDSRQAVGEQRVEVAPTPKEAVAEEISVEPVIAVSVEEPQVKPEVPEVAAEDAKPKRSKTKKDDITEDIPF